MDVLLFGGGPRVESLGWCLGESGFEVVIESDYLTARAVLATQIPAVVVLCEDVRFDEIGAAAVYGTAWLEAKMAQKTLVFLTVSDHQRTRCEFRVVTGGMAVVWGVALATIERFLKEVKAK